MILRKKKKKIWAGVFQVGVAKWVTNRGDGAWGNCGPEPDFGARLERIMKLELETGKGSQD